MAKVLSSNQDTENEETEADMSKALSNKISRKIAHLKERLPELDEVLEVHDKIGEGTFSCVYLASKRGEPQRRFAIKHLIPTCHPDRVSTELSSMYQMGGVDNITEVLMCLRKHDCIVFVMPYLEHERFTSYVLEMDVEETQNYLRQLLLALRRVHSFGVIHRDVKPSNFLYNRRDRKFLLVDFGLAQKVEDCSKGGPGLEDGENSDSLTNSRKRKREVDGENVKPEWERVVKRQALEQLRNKANTTAMVPLGGVGRRPPLQAVNSSQLSFVRPSNPQLRGEFVKPEPVKSGGRCDCDGKPRVCNLCLTRKSPSAPRAGTPGFRPPEVLLKYPYQTQAVDMWAVGVMLLSILSGTYPFFRSPDDVTGLAEIITVFGVERVRAVANKLGRNVICSEITKGVDLKDLCKSMRFSREDSKGLTHVEFPDMAFDLLHRLLDLDPATRISAADALNHPFIATNNGRSKGPC